MRPNRSFSALSVSLPAAVAAALVAGAVATAAAGAAGTERGAGAGRGAGTARGARPAGCRPAGAHVLAADRAAQVFSLRGSAYGCVNPAGARRLLGSAGPCLNPRGAGSVAPIKLAGTIVAFGVTRCGVDTGSGSLVVRELASGRMRANLPAVTQAVGPESYTSVKAIVVRRDGTVGWIAGGGSIISHRSNYEVHRFASGRATLLDSGPSIAPSSLKLQGSQMTWRDGQATRSATLP